MTVSVSTEISGDVTVTVQVARKPPSKVLTVIMAVPAETALTVPISSTVATVSLSDAQRTSLIVAFSGDTDGIRKKFLRSSEIFQADPTGCFLRKYVPELFPWCRKKLLFFLRIHLQESRFLYQGSGFLECRYCRFSEVRGISL